ncbi:MAG: hypothetical protein ACFFDN_00550 [Candidatus Hodarchaeota archaeon]
MKEESKKKLVNGLKYILFYLKLVCFVILIIISLGIAMIFMSDEEHEYYEVEGQLWRK